MTSALGTLLGVFGALALWLTISLTDLAIAAIARRLRRRRQLRKIIQRREQDSVLRQSAYDREPARRLRSLLPADRAAPSHDVSAHRPAFFARAA